MKPKLSVLINAYGDYYRQRQVKDDQRQIERYDNLTLIENRNKSSLELMTHKDYDQKSFKELISAIELNGITSFNMTTFWGKIAEGIERNLGNSLDMPIHSLSLHYEETSKGANTLDQYTSAFNCNSVGCIAGFAMAIAMDWKQPDWLTEDSRNYMHSFENIACNYLNIPIQVGRKIFYGDEASVWAFVAYHERENHQNLEWSNWEDDEYDDFDWTEESIELSSIDYKVAVDVLRRIASGEIIFSDEFIPQYKQQ